jgi:hypothetical protein
MMFVAILGGVWLFFFYMFTSKTRPLQSSEARPEHLQGGGTQRQTSLCRQSVGTILLLDRRLDGLSCLPNDLGKTGAGEGNSMGPF